MAPDSPPPSSVTAYGRDRVQLAMEDDMMTDMVVSLSREHTHTHIHTWTSCYMTVIVFLHQGSQWQREGGRGAALPAWRHYQAESGSDVEVSRLLWWATNTQMYSQTIHIYCGNLCYFLLGVPRHSWWWIGWRASLRIKLETFQTTLNITPRTSAGEFLTKRINLWFNPGGIHGCTMRTLLPLWWFDDSSQWPLKLLKQKYRMAQKAFSTF